MLIILTLSGLIGSLGGEEVREILEKGDLLYSRGDYAEASEYYREILPDAEFFKNPDELYYRLILCYMNLNREDLIFDVYNQIIENYKGSTYLNEALTYNINFHTKNNRFQKAEKLLHTAIKLFPKSAFYITLLGDTYRKEKHYKKAADEYKKVLNIFGFTKNIYQKIINTYIDDGNYYKGIDFLKKSIKKKTDFIAGLMGDLFFRAGELREAEKEFLYAYSISKNNKYLIQAGNIYLQTNRQKTLSFYMKLIEEKKAMEEFYNVAKSELKNKDMELEAERTALEREYNQLKTDVYHQ